jgi:hypothetical protein
MKKMTPEERFFWLNAGFCYDPKTQTKAQGHRECAEKLAEAESLARRMNWMYEWNDDWTVNSHQKYYGTDSAYKDGEPDTCEYCVLYDEHREHLASLGCIDDADANYRRVIEAELALEAMGNLDREIETLDAH